MTGGIVDNVKVRVRTHDPSRVFEEEFDHIGDAVLFLDLIRKVVKKP